MKEKNYEFLRRHWRVHRPDRRDFGRKAAEHEVMLTERRCSIRRSGIFRIIFLKAWGFP